MTPVRSLTTYSPSTSTLMSPLSCSPIDSRHYERMMASLLAPQTVDIADCHTSDVHDNQDPTPSPPCPCYLDCRHKRDHLPCHCDTDSSLVAGSKQRHDRLAEHRRRQSCHHLQSSPPSPLAPHANVGMSSARSLNSPAASVPRHWQPLRVTLTVD